LDFDQSLINCLADHTRRHDLGAQIGEEADKAELHFEARGYFAAKKA
jgi:hypothetical protein